MQLDEMKQAWAAHSAALERSLSINERLLREVMVRKIRVALAPYVVRRAAEVALGILAAILVAKVLIDHPGQRLYLAVAGPTLAYLVAMIATSAYLLIHATQLDYVGPLTDTRREFERLKLVEYHAFKWALLGGIVLWLPMALLLFEALVGVHALARVHLPWVGANIVLGLLLLAAGQALSRRFVEHRNLRPWAQRLVENVSGRELQSVTKSLAELASFEREEAG